MQESGVHRKSLKRKALSAIGKCEERNRVKEWYKKGQKPGLFPVNKVVNKRGVVATPGRGRPKKSKDDVFTVVARSSKRIAQKNSKLQIKTR
jgi:hypothetical protein